MSLNNTLLVTIVKYTQIHLEEQAKKPVTRIPFWFPTKGPKPPIKKKKRRRNQKNKNRNRMRLIVITTISLSHHDQIVCRVNRRQPVE